MIVAPLQGHFDGGEVSPLLYGRVDSERYKSSLALCKNWIPTLQGGLPRRPGSQYMGAVKNSAHKVLLVPFEFSTTQAYMLEFGNVTTFAGQSGYVRIYANYGVVQNGGSPIEVVVPYQESDLPLLRFTQSADVLYIVHPAYPPATLSRVSATSWVYTVISFIDGPYKPVNASPLIAMFASATTGTAVTVTANIMSTATTAVASIAVSGAANNGSGLIRLTIPASYLGTNIFQTGDFVTVSGIVGTTEANGTWKVTAVDPTHIDLTTKAFVGTPSAFVNAWVSGGTIVAAPFVDALNSASMPVRLKGATWGWGTITSIDTSNYATATVAVGSAFADTSVTTTWRLGFWTPTNYPGSVSFHEDRLCFGGAPNSPQRIDMSSTSDYKNFAPSLASGTVTDASACNFSLNANEVNFNEWLSSDEKGLLAGSLSAEWILRPSVNSEAVTPTNVSAKRSTRWGSAAVQAVQVGKATLHVQRGSRKLRELVYNFYIDGYASTDLTELAEHITGTGVTQLVYTAIPHPIVWLLRNDGALVGATYDRDVQQLRVGWHWHVLGGKGDAAGSAPVIESIAAIPSPDGSRQDLWMAVRRYINGATVRTIEVLTKIFEDIDLPQYAFHLDCGLTYDAPVTVAGITKANPGVVNAVAHGFSTGNTVRFDGIVGMTELNGNRYTVTVVDVDHFTLTDLHGNAVDSTAFLAYVSGGQVRKLVSAISGLTYLQGETVSIWADGVAQPDQVVSGGQITLTNPAAVVSVGYSYNSDGELLRLEAGSRNGTSIGKVRRTHRVGLMVHRAQGLQIGKDFSSLDPVQLRTQGVDPNGTASALFSGIESFPTDFANDFDNQLCFRVSNPGPCTLLAIMPQMETQDRA